MLSVWDIGLGLRGLAGLKVSSKGLGFGVQGLADFQGLKRVWNLGWTARTGQWQKWSIRSRWPRRSGTTPTRGGREP